MTWWRVLGARLAGVFGRDERDAALDVEIREHLDRLAEDHMRRGLAPRAARAAARRDFGGVDQLKERYRDRRGVPAFEILARDLRLALRSLRRTPGVTLTIVLTLAFAVGANTAIFSLVNAVVLRPFRYEGADRLVTIHEVVRKIPSAPLLPANALHFEEWRRSTQSFEQMALIRDISVNLTGTGDPERLTAGRVSASLFPMLGVRAQIGRTFVEQEDRAGQDRVVVLTDGLWRRRFGADPGIVGRSITLDDQPFVVVGVLPPGFWFPKISDLYAIAVVTTQPELWKPFGLRDAERNPSGDYNYACIAKLHPDVSLAQAASELRVVQSRIDERLVEKLDHDAAVIPLAAQVTSRSRSGLWLVLAASGVVLLIGCVNVASLLLGRAATRQREFAIRKAIGASNGRLVLQVLTECGALCSMAALVGIAFAYATLRLVISRAPLDLPRIADANVDGRVLGFALLALVATTLLVGIVPAWRAMHSEVAVGDHAGRITAGRHTARARSLLVIAEISLSTVCLVAAGLLLHSFVRLQRVDKGFDPERLMLVELMLTPQRYPDLPATTTFVRRVLEGLVVLPGLRSAGVVSQPPLGGVGGNNTVFADGVVVPPSQRTIVDFRPVNPEYFKTAGIPLENGRVFEDVDGERRVAVLSASAAARVWPGRNPLGRTFHLGSPDNPAITVVGIVGDVRGVSLSDPVSPTVYLPYWQRGFNRNRVSFVVRSAIDPNAASQAIRRAIHKVDPALPVTAVRTMHEVVDASLAPRRFQTTLVTLFAAAALLLVVLGTYGVMSYSVTQRTKEIGIRLALGARRMQVVGEVLAAALRVVAVGLIVGVPLAIAAGYGLEALLFGVMPSDAVSIATTCMVLTCTAAAAALAPAWRASRIDPVVALRQE